MRSGYMESRFRSNHWTPSDFHFQRALRKPCTRAIRSLCRASVWAGDQKMGRSRAASTVLAEPALAGARDRALHDLPALILTADVALPDAGPL
jgi:hypothetical protein